MLLRPARCLHLHPSRPAAPPLPAHPLSPPLESPALPLYPARPAAPALSVPPRPPPPLLPPLLPPPPPPLLLHPLSPGLRLLPSVASRGLRVGRPEAAGRCRPRGMRQRHRLLRSRRLAPARLAVHGEQRLSGQRSDNAPRNRHRTARRSTFTDTQHSVPSLHTHPSSRHRPHEGRGLTRRLQRLPARAKRPTDGSRGAQG